MLRKWWKVKVNTTPLQKQKNSVEIEVKDSFLNNKLIIILFGINFVTDFWENKNFTDF